MSEARTQSFCDSKNKKEETLSLHDKLHKAQESLGADIPDPTINAANIIETTHILESLQDDIRRVSIFSTNDTLQDISTPSLSLLSTEFLLGKAVLQISSNSSAQRKKSVIKATESLYGFLRICETLELWKEDVKRDYHALLDLDDCNEENEETIGKNNSVKTMWMAGEARQAKIARFRLTKSLIQRKSHLSALYSQRDRLGLAEHEIIDGHDEDGLSRSIVLAELNLNAVDAIEEIHNCRREIEMLEIAMKIEETRNAMYHYNGVNFLESSVMVLGNETNEMRTPPQNSACKKPLKMTRIISDPETGQIFMRKEHVRSQIFRPGWNQPTMTLAELGDQEHKEAVLRSQQQKAAEEHAKHAPKRYNQLLRDGMEDNANMVDQSSVLDRKWDDWKDENPRGGGNKMGDRGDRNF